jgi:hypothetical protein
MAGGQRSKADSLQGQLLLNRAVNGGKSLKTLPRLNWLYVSDHPLQPARQFSREGFVLIQEGNWSSDPFDAPDIPDG